LVLCLDAANKRSYPGSGTTWFDLSGNGNNGTLVNGVGFNGDNGGGLVFDGLNDTVSIGQILNIMFSNDSFTICLWVKPNQLSHPYTYFQVGGGSYSNFPNVSKGVSIGVAGDSQFFRAQITDGFVNRRIGISNFGFVANQWVSIVYLVDRNLNDSELFKNGFKLSNTNLSTFGSSTTSTSANIGLDVEGSNFGPANITVSNCHIYNRALSAQEIRQNFNALRGRYGI